MCPAEDPIAEARNGDKQVVLVVEDEVLIRMTVADHLRDSGFKVVEALSGAEAQALILGGLHVDLIFSDITMPGGVDGIALAQWLHETGVEAPIVLTSGVPNNLEEARAKATHVRALIAKPYDYDALVSQLQSLLRG